MKGEGILRWMLILVAVCLPAVWMQGQEIRTSAPDEVLAQETFQIEYQIISDSPIREVPTLVAAKNFELLAEPTLRQTSPSPFWGERYYTLSVSCVFKAKKTGKLALPRIELIVDGQKMTSKKGIILVRELPELEEIKSFVKMDLSKTSVNVGDTLTVTYKLYTTREVSNLLNISIPGLRNFQYQDISPRRITYTEERVKGVDYKVYTVRRYLLQAKTLGRQVLGEGAIEVEYSYPTGRVRTDAWGREYEEVLRETRTSPIAETSILVHDMVAI